MSVVTTAAQRSRVQNVCTDGLTALRLPPLAGIWVAGVCWLLAGLLMGWPLLAAACQWLHRLLCPRLFPKFTPTMGHVKVGTADVSVAIALCCWPCLLLCLLHATCMTCHVACAALVTCLVASALFQVTLLLLGCLHVACASWLCTIIQHYLCSMENKHHMSMVDAMPKTRKSLSPVHNPLTNTTSLSKFLPTPAEYVVLTTI